METPSCTLTESDPELAYRMVAVGAALEALDVRPADRILIMLPDGPGLTGASASVSRRGAVPLPVSPRLTAHDVIAVVAEKAARLVLAGADRIQTLAGLDADPPVLVNGPQGVWAAVLRLR